MQREEQRVRAQDVMLGNTVHCHSLARALDAPGQKSSHIPCDAVHTAATHLHVRDIVCRQVERREVGLREVAVVREALLGAHAPRRLGGLVPGARLLHYVCAILDEAHLQAQRETLSEPMRLVNQADLRAMLLRSH